jgi:hypothetical protein
METVVEEPAEVTTEAEDPNVESEPLDSGATAPSLDDLKGKYIFISHKCDVPADETLARQLYESLTDLGCDVYLDKAQPIGRDYEKAIDQALQRADFVLALLTKDSNDSDWVKAELSYAHKLLKRHGRPKIIPIQVGFFERTATIRAICVSANFRTYEASDYEQILRDIKVAMVGGVEDLQPFRIGLEAFLVGEFRKTLTRAAATDSPELRRANEQLKKEKLFWAVGDSGVRNHFARVLAVKEFDSGLATNGNQGKELNIYEVHWSFNWSKVDETLVSNSIIIFPDVDPNNLFGEDLSTDAITALKNLSERNLVIVTASEEAYQEIKHEMRNRDFEGGAHLILNHDFYKDHARLQMFEGLLAQSPNLRLINDNQVRWTRKLLDAPQDHEVFLKILRKWSPADIERFVTEHLRNAKRQGDILTLLERNADLDDEIHEWFLGLDDSTRCFVLALAMLSGLNREELWANYKLILKNLKKLDANLSLWPLGICRQRSSPYVTNEAQPGFVDERIAETIYTEVIENFREYLIELCPLMTELTIPKGREVKTAFETRKAEATKTRELRVAFARLVGKAARQGVTDLTDLLKAWGADPVLSVREAVAISLEQAVTDRVGARQALALLETWCNDRGEGDPLRRNWAAASALASILTAKPAGDTHRRALDLLDGLAHRNHTSIKFYLSISLKKAVRKIPLRDGESPLNLESLLAVVASDENFSTKINVAEALCQARIADETATLAVVHAWLNGEDIDCRWAAICCILMWLWRRKKNLGQDITACLAIDRESTASVLVEILNEKEQMFWQSLRKFLLSSDAATLPVLIAGLADLPHKRLDEKLLPRLRAAENAALNNIAIEVRAEKWRRLLLSPTEFITDLQQELLKQEFAGEIFAALSRLLKTEPEGYRAHVISALVSCFVAERAKLEDVLTRLTMLGPYIFEPLALEIRFEAFKSLIQTPAVLLDAINYGLGDPRIAAETATALEMLIRPEPNGYCEEVLTMLSAAQATDPPAVTALLHRMRAMNTLTLSEFSYQFSLRLLVALIGDPSNFAVRVADSMQNSGGERGETLQILKLLTTPEPHGRRQSLVRTLGLARSSQPETVNLLLQDSSWQTRSGLISVSTEVKLFSFLTSVVSERFASKILEFVS